MATMFDTIIKPGIKVLVKTPADLVLYVTEEHKYKGDMRLIKLNSLDDCFSIWLGLQNIYVLRIQYLEKLLDDGHKVSMIDTDDLSTWTEDLERVEVHYTYNFVKETWEVINE